VTEPGAIAEPNPAPAAPQPDATEKHWRSTVTLLAWLLIVQSALSLLTSLIGLATAPLTDIPNLSGQLGVLMDRSAIGQIEELMRLVRTANNYFIIYSVASLAGAIGLLLRRKWGWYATALINVATALATIVWGTPIVTRIYTMLDPKNGGPYGLLTAILLALMPAIFVGFLMLKPVIIQFEKPRGA